MPHLKMVERTRVAEEAAGQATFGVELSGSIGSFEDLRYNSISPNLPETLLADMARVQRPYTRNPQVVGPRSTEIQTECDVVSGLLLDAGASAPGTPDWGLGLLWKIAFGGYRSAAGSTEDGGAASTASLLNVAAGHGTRWTAGGAYAVMVAGGAIEAREVASVAADALTPKIQHSAAPVNAAPVYNAHTFYPTSDPETSAQFLFETGDRDAIYWALGHQLGSFSLVTTLGQLARCAMTWKGATWAQDSSVGTPLGGGAMGVASFAPGREPTPYINSDVLFNVAGAAPLAPTPVDPETIAFTFNHTFEPVLSPRGKGAGILRWFIRPPEQGTPLATVTLTIPLEDTEERLKVYQEARAARTPFYCFAQIGNVPGNIFLVSMPKMQIIDAQPVDSNRLHAAQVTAMVLEDSYATDQADDLRRAPFRLHTM